MRRRLNDDSISKLLEDLSTPDLSSYLKKSSEEDPFCDDGEYGSDKDIEPDFKYLSSDVDTLPKVNIYAVDIGLNPKASLDNNQSLIDQIKNIPSE